MLRAVGTGKLGIAGEAGLPLSGSSPPGRGWLPVRGWRVCPQEGLFFLFFLFEFN